uniref:Gypsy retrotransposon integrase-like protein 1 n=1 Tax=Lepisosteus oculatus TaxID=7918 RepID=W5LVJ2_LEPOC
VGFRLTGAGLTPLQSNIEAIQRIPEPTTPAQVTSFLGFSLDRSRFLPHYLVTKAPLHQLLQKGAPWVWTHACSESHLLKAQLTSLPVLTHFDLSSPTFITCDTSSTAVGAVLSQLHNRIAFTSQALSPAEQKYSLGEREVWSCERRHMYLYSCRFMLEALTALLTTSGTGHRPLRLASERLQQYNFALKFTPGHENVERDSRAATFPNLPGVPESDTLEPDLIQMLYTQLQTIVALQELQKALEQDPVLSQLHTFICSGWPSKVSAWMSSCWNDSCVAQGPTVVPASLQAHVLQMAHAGHLGIVMVKQQRQDLVRWPGINRDIEALVRNCKACLLIRKTGGPPLQPLDWLAKPWDHLQLHICGELCGVLPHQRFLIKAYDFPSKWPEVASTGSVTTQAVTVFLESLFARWGLPTIITTDNGLQFSRECFLADRGIRHLHTAFYNPKANRGVEPLNHTQKPHQSPPVQGLFLLSHAEHTPTGSSPAFIMLGHELQMPLDRL